MLEDEADRLERFSAVLQAFDPDLELRHWRTVHDFIAGYQEVEQTPILICLDHDLFTDHPDDPDPGDGRDVAAYMARRTPVCRVLIHSTNHFAAESMLYTLQDAGWGVERIAPLGSDWIEAYWWPTVKPWIVEAIGID